MSVVRLVLGLAGVAVAAYGGVLLLERGLTDLPGVVLWLAGGVVAHDLILAPATLVLVAVARRSLPGRWWVPAARVLVVLGTVTVMAIPVLGRFGAERDNATLLDRPYWTGWILVATLVTAVATVVRGGGGSGGQGAGGRRRPHRP